MSAGPSCCSLKYPAVLSLNTTGLVVLIEPSENIKPLTSPVQSSLKTSSKYTKGRPGLQCQWFDCLSEGLKVPQERPVVRARPALTGEAEHGLSLPPAGLEVVSAIEVCDLLPSQDPPPGYHDGLVPLVVLHGVHVTAVVEQRADAVECLHNTKYRFISVILVLLSLLPRQSLR